LYSENFYAPTTDQPKIPKIMHRFWIGGDPPPLYLQYEQTCKDLHKEWKFILWNDENIGELEYDKELFNGFGDQIEGKKDYLSFLAIQKYGGVYMDFDFVCLQPLDELVYRWRYFSTLEPPMPWATMPSTTVCVIGAEPNHPVIGRFLEL